MAGSSESGWAVSAIVMPLPPPLEPPHAARAIAQATVITALNVLILHMRTGGKIGAGVVAVLVACSLAAPLWAENVAHTGPNTTHVTESVYGQPVISRQGVPIGPTWRSRFFLGADPEGRDVMVRLLYGGRGGGPRPGGRPRRPRPPRRFALGGRPWGRCGRGPRSTLSSRARSTLSGRSPRSCSPARSA